MPEPSGNSHDAADISVDVLIVGAGFSGICMGIKLLEAGVKNFLIIEKSEDLGGTWYENRYPGCACDVPAHLYSFSFDRNPNWTRMFAGQQEIWQYLKSCVERYGLGPYLRFKTRFCEAAWDEAAGHWRIARDLDLKVAVGIRAWSRKYGHTTSRFRVLQIFPQNMDAFGAFRRRNNIDRSKRTKRRDCSHCFATAGANSESARYKYVFARHGASPVATPSVAKQDASPAS